MTQTRSGTKKEYQIDGSKRQYLGKAPSFRDHGKLLDGAVVFLNIKFFNEEKKAESFCFDVGSIDGVVLVPKLLQLMPKCEIH
ncbi:hypothetical protein JZO70_13160 [Enterococcus sp. 669A]|uniref:Uncharacterized protein n=1 Tax=Candidatus Enterococcus moelleringii TaxID=2815325 RepID=A0ABS3LBW2_9ENTE|nr:hypothetical protein [Enterococcus sp. 669A]MBO1307119.1 hypothetical protein [Enterococcus sp. 669A]